MAAAQRASGWYNPRGEGGAEGYLTAIPGVKRYNGAQNGEAGSWGLEPSERGNYRRPRRTTQKEQSSDQESQNRRQLFLRLAGISQQISCRDVAL